MRKISLDPERLQVESFETGDDARARGTVHGHWSQVGTCVAWGEVATCQLNGTCKYTCSRCTVTPV